MILHFSCDVHCTVHLLFVLFAYLLFFSGKLFNLFFLFSAGYLDASSDMSSLRQDEAVQNPFMGEESIQELLNVLTNELVHSSSDRERK